jgi:hypothetical protein
MNAEGQPEILGAELNNGHGRPFLIVSYYTVNTGYEKEIDHLRASCQAFQLDYFFEGIKSLGSWQLNIHYKPAFLLAALTRFEKPIVWIDSDAVIKQYPALFESLAKRDNIDLAVHYFRDRELLTGTLYIPFSTAAIGLLQAWRGYDGSRLKDKEQRTLQDLLASRPGYRVVKLPPEYTKIFDLMRNNGGPAVIEHHQASRKFRRQVSGDPDPERITTALVRARIKQMTRRRR